MARFHKMGWISGLKGRKDGPGWYARSVTGMIHTLRAKGLATSASDNGSINVWRMRNGTYRMEFHRFMRILRASEAKSIADVRRWLFVNFPEMDNK